jgi:hypothetical protein
MTVPRTPGAPAPSLRSAAGQGDALLAATLWRGVLAVAAAAAGLAAIAYGVGAATLWIELHGRGYSPDAGIAHQPRSETIVLGLRGALAVGALTLAAAALAWLVGVIVRSKRTIVAGRRRWHWALVLVALLAIALAAWFNWRLLAAAITVVTVGLVVLLHAGERKRRWHWALVPVAVVLASIAWLLGGPVYVASVTVSPKKLLPIKRGIFEFDHCVLPDGTYATSRYVRIEGQRVWLASKNGCGEHPTERGSTIADVIRSCAVPYFGETNDFVYLGGIENVRQEEDGSCRWDAGPIVEVRRDRVRLRFFKAKAFLTGTQDRPLLVGLSALGSLAGKLWPRGHEERYPGLIRLPDGFAPDGIEIGEGRTFYVGSRSTGQIYRGHLQTGKGEILVDLPRGRPAGGLALDQRNRLFVAGMGTGDAYVYEATTGKLLRRYSFASARAVVDDVVVTDRAAYFTDSTNPVLYRIPIGPSGALGGAKTISLRGDAVANLTGIDVTPGGKWLVAVQSFDGTLHRIDPANGEVKAIRIRNDETVRSGDGILLDGRRLYIAETQNNDIAVIALAPNLASGHLETRLAETTLDDPTAVDGYGTRLYAVNGRLGIIDSDAQYEIVQLAKPNRP